MKKLLVVIMMIISIGALSNVAKGIDENDMYEYYDSAMNEKWHCEDSAEQSAYLAKVSMENVKAEAYAKKQEALNISGVTDTDPLIILGNQALTDGINHESAGLIYYMYADNLKQTGNTYIDSGMMNWYIGGPTGYAAAIVAFSEAQAAFKYSSLAFNGTSYFYYNGHPNYQNHAKASFIDARSKYYLAIEYFQAIIDGHYFL